MEIVLMVDMSCHCSYRGKGLCIEENNTEMD